MGDNTARPPCVFCLAVGSFRACTAVGGRRGRIAGQRGAAMGMGFKHLHSGYIGNNTPKRSGVRSGVARSGCQRVELLLGDIVSHIRQCGADGMRKHDGAKGWEQVRPRPKRLVTKGRSMNSHRETVWRICRGVDNVKDKHGRRNSNY